MRLTIACLTIAALALAACGPAAPGAPASQAAQSEIETTCRTAVTERLAAGETVQFGDFTVVEYREYSGGVRKAVMDAMSGQTLGTMSAAVDRALGSGENGADETYRMGLRISGVRGNSAGWCRTKGSTCVCEVSRP